MDKKKMQRLRRLAKKLGFSIITVKGPYVSNDDGEWKYDKDGHAYKRAFKNLKAYALVKNETGEIITPYEYDICSNRKGKGCIKSDILFDELEEIINDAWIMHRDYHSNLCRIIKAPT